MSFLWFRIRDIRLNDPSSGIIHVDVGVVDKRYPLSFFEIPPDCSPISAFVNAHLEGSRIAALVVEVPFTTHRFILVCLAISSHIFRALFPLNDITNSMNSATNSISYMAKMLSFDANATHDGQMESMPIVFSSLACSSSPSSIPYHLSLDQSNPNCPSSAALTLPTSCLCTSNTMKGYSKVEVSKTISASTEAQQSEEAHDLSPWQNKEIGRERFGVILSRSCSSASRRFRANNGSRAKSEASTTLQAAVRRAFSMKKSSSVREGYWRIHGTGDEDSHGEFMEQQMTCTREKKKGKLLKACKRLFGF
ncbi:hypothetical protein Cni_G05243 [Canna indica]|uniref:Uncharacterized protein n=1 Tax=Canna indica TaxID=4628 RepID=A0AAQ3JXD6_9LILI|nr:hypothetical protein Cni_G05243 [Canna indica]